MPASTGNPTTDPTVLREADAFFETLDSTPPDAVTACLGWTTHEMIAHIASGADAFANQIEAHLDGRPVPEFGSWEVREPPYRELPDAVLRRRLNASEQRMSAAFETMLAADPVAAVAEVGWGLPIAELVTHMRQEFAIHRWDLIGDDEIGRSLLSRPVLLDHSARLLGDSLFKFGLPRDPSPQTPLTVRLRCADEPDLVVDVRDGTGTLTLADPADADRVIETDAAARLLILWGRRPSDPRRVRSALPPAELARLQTLLAGY